MLKSYCGSLYEPILCRELASKPSFGVKKFSARLATVVSRLGKPGLVSTELLGTGKTEL